MVAERRVVSVTAVASAWLCMTEGSLPDLILAANSKVVPGVKTIFQPV